MRKLYNMKEDLNNVLGAIGRFARAAVSNKQLLALVLLALVSLVSVIAGAWLSFRFSGLVCTWLEPYLEVSPAVLQAIAFFLIMLVVMAVLALVGKAVRSILKFAMLGWLDKLLGMAFALLKAGLAIGIAVILFNTLNTKLELVKPEVLDQSVLYGHVKDIAYAVFPYFKELLVK